LSRFWAFAIFNLAIVPARFPPPEVQLREIKPTVGPEEDLGRNPNAVIKMIEMPINQ